MSDSRAVQQFIDALEHPRKETVAALRTLLLDAVPGIEEALKWNAPSFRYAATIASP